MKNILLALTGACLLLSSCKKEEEVSTIKADQKLGAPVNTLADFSTISKFTDYNQAYPQGILAAPGGALYVSENGGIKKIEPDGTIKTLLGKALPFPTDLTISESGVVYVVDIVKKRIYKIDSNDKIVGIDICMLDANGERKPITDFDPRKLVAGENGSLYIADANSKIFKLEKTGIATVFAGSVSGYQDGPKANAKFGSITSLVRKKDGTLLLGELINVKGAYFTRIRVISTSGEVSTLAGGALGFKDGASANAQFYFIRAMVFSEDESTLYLVDDGNQRIRKIDSFGNVSTIAGIAGYSPNQTGPSLDTYLEEPRDLAIIGNTIFFVSSFHVFKLG